MGEAYLLVRLYRGSVRKTIKAQIDTNQLARPVYTKPTICILMCVDETETGSRVPELPYQESAAKGVLCVFPRGEGVVEECPVLT